MKRTSRQRRAAQAGKIRIIGGHWRGTRLDVADVAGLRPSSDRVRETLFNWLQADIRGARCLDLFAGSGALGLEAASRGAAQVVMIERDTRALANLRASVQRLDASQVEVVADDALAWLARPPTCAFDLVFIDPPFASGLMQTVLDRLGPWLAPAAQVYVEFGVESALPELAGFTPRRDGHTRETRFHLLHRTMGLSGRNAPVTLEPHSGVGTTSTT
ncbi:MAG TPA: 16S rRNA (guanine(966)-N(2))-methyltransferase RsmD [Chiayiivirga sp.]|nr:16S rRNA (guanine(966)-N(2))-methyltransferase RsmD [Chiayiivirga sp.]